MLAADFAAGIGIPSQDLAGPAEARPAKHREGLVIWLRLRTNPPGSGRRANLPSAPLIVLGAVLASGGCSHMIDIKASQPIVIQLDVKIEQAVRVHVDPEASAIVSELLEPADTKPRTAAKPTASPKKPPAQNSKDQPRTIHAADGEDR